MTSAVLLRFFSGIGGVMKAYAHTDPAFRSDMNLPLPVYFSKQKRREPENAVQIPYPIRTGRITVIG